MAKSSVILAAALKAGATSIISPAQAVIRNQDSATQTLEDNFTLVAGRDYFRDKRHCGRLKIWRDLHPSWGTCRHRGRWP